MNLTMKEDQILNGLHKMDLKLELKAMNQD